MSCELWALWWAMCECFKLMTDPLTPQLNVWLTSQNYGGIAYIYSILYLYCITHQRLPFLCVSFLSWGTASSISLSLPFTQAARTEERRAEQTSKNNTDIPMVLVYNEPQPPLRWHKVQNKTHKLGRNSSDVHFLQWLVWSQQCERNVNRPNDLWRSIFHLCLW